MGDIENISSFVKGLETFLHKWSKPLDLRCKDHTDDRIKAGYYVWARYTMSVRTVAHLSEPQFLPDLFVIARCCFEYRAALRAVLKDQEIAGQYLDFEKQALCSYKKHLEDTGQTEQAMQVDGALKKMGIADSSNYRPRWCKGGYSKLIEKHGGCNDLKPYRLLSDFVHGSIVALRFLQNHPPTAKPAVKMCEMVYLGYASVTRSFLDGTWGSIITPDAKRSKKAFTDVSNCLIQP